MKIEPSLEIQVFIDRGGDVDPIELEISSAELEAGTVWVYVKVEPDVRAVTAERQLATLMQEIARLCATAGDRATMPGVHRREAQRWAERLSRVLDDR